MEYNEELEQKKAAISQPGGYQIKVESYRLWLVGLVLAVVAAIVFSKGFYPALVSRQWVTAGVYILIGLFVLSLIRMRVSTIPVKVVIKTDVIEISTLFRVQGYSLVDVESFNNPGGYRAQSRQVIRMKNGDLYDFLSESMADELKELLEYLGVLKEEL